MAGLGVIGVLLCGCSEPTKRSHHFAKRIVQFATGPGNKDPLLLLLLLYMSLRQDFTIKNCMNISTIQCCVLNLMVKEGYRGGKWVKDNKT